MQKIRIPGTEMEVSRVALGTWAIGGWMWGGTEEEQSIARSNPISSLIANTTTSL